MEQSDHAIKLPSEHFPRHYVSVIHFGYERGVFLFLYNQF